MSNKTTKVAGVLALSTIAGAAASGVAHADNYEWDGKTTHLHGHKISVGSGWSGSYTLLNKSQAGTGIFYCADPDKDGPSEGGLYTPGGTVAGNWINQDGKQVSPATATNQIAFVLSKYGNTTDNDRASAVEAAVYSLQGLQGWQLDDGKGDLSKSDPRADARMNEAGPNVHQLAVDMMQDARANSVDSYSTTVTMPKEVKAGTDYTVTAKVVGRGGDGNGKPLNGAAAGLKATFKDASGKTVTAPINENGVATATFKAGSSNPSVTVSAETYSTDVDWWKPTTTNAQRLMISGARTAVTGSAQATLSPWTPVATTVTSNVVTDGKTPITDTVNVSGGQPGVKFEGTATLYGPLATQPKEQATVPAGTPVVGSAKFSGVYGPNGTATAKTTPLTPAKGSGYYVWVETLNPTATSEKYTEHFGVTKETSLVYTPTVSTQVNNQKAVPGQPISDTVTVAGIKTTAPDGSPIKNVVTGTLSYTPAMNGDCTKVDWSKATKVADVPATPVSKDGSFTTAPYTVDKAGCYSYGETLTATPTTGTPIVVEHKTGLTPQTSTVTQPAVTTTAHSSDVYAGSNLVDEVKVTGTNGQEGVITGSIIGPVEGTNGDCTKVDWSKVPVSAAITPITVKGDGTYKTAPFKTSTPGCYTFVEKLQLKNGAKAVNTKPGESRETVYLKNKPVAPVEHTTRVVVHETTPTAPATVAHINSGVAADQGANGLGMAAGSFGLLSALGLGAAARRRFTK